MPIAFECGSCKHELRAFEHLVGRVLRCPQCKGEFAVPALGTGNPPAHYVERISNKPVAARPAPVAPAAPLAPVAPMIPATAAPFAPMEPASLSPMEPAPLEPSPFEPMAAEPAPFEPAALEPSPFEPVPTDGTAPLEPLAADAALTPMEASPFEAAEPTLAAPSGQELELTPDMLVDASASATGEATAPVEDPMLDQIFAEMQQENTGDLAGTETVAMEEISIVDDGVVTIDDGAVVVDEGAMVVEEAPLEEIMVVEDVEPPKKKKKK